MILKSAEKRMNLNSNITRVLMLLISGLSLLSCDQPKVKVKDTKESQSNKVSIIAEPGETVLPVFNDTLDFIGLPCYLGAKEAGENADLYLIFGKDFPTRKKLDIQPIATMNYSFRKQSRTIHVAVPNESKYQNWVVEENEDFNIDYGFLKLWIQDWLVYSYPEDQFEFVDWQTYQE